MERTDILEKITAIIKETLDNESLVITENDSNETIDGWDSLSHIIILSEIEDYFSIKIPMNKYQEARKVSTMIDIVQSLA